MKNFFKELPDGYELIKIVDAKTKSFSLFMTVGSLLLTVIVFLISISFKKIEFMFDYNIPYLLLIVVIFVVLMFGSIIFHELLHGLVYKVLTKEKREVSGNVCCRCNVYGRTKR